MESQNEQGGYIDEIFIAEPPDYLRCVVCSLILRDPVQILTCGHLFCSVCFTQYSESRSTTYPSTELMCPVDRNVVDPLKVNEDVAMQRIIGNLRVRCGEHEGGCEWSGDLREWEKHCQACVFVLQKQQAQGFGDGSKMETEKLICELNDRVLRCEISLADKDRELAVRDKEIIFLKDKIQKMQESHMALAVRVDGLNEKNASTQNLQADFDIFSRKVSERLNKKDEEIAELKHLFQGCNVTVPLPEFHKSVEFRDMEISDVEVTELQSSSVELLEVQALEADPLDFGTSVEYRDVGVSDVLAPEIQSPAEPELQTPEAKALTIQTSLELSSGVEPPEVQTSATALLEVQTAEAKPPELGTSAFEPVEVKAVIVSSPKVKNVNVKPPKAKNVNTKPPKVKTAARSVNICCKTKADPLTVRLHQGRSCEITFSMLSIRQIKFKECSMASLPDVIIKDGMKVYYEVEFLERRDFGKYGWSRCQIGWAARNFKTIQCQSDKGVGEVLHSYARDPISMCKTFVHLTSFMYNWGGRKWRNDLFSELRGTLRNAPSGRRCVGVALDMVRGKLNYSINGGWGDIISKESMLKEHLFPVLIGANVTVEVNVGDRPFAYGPPDDSYKSLFEISSLM